MNVESARQAELEQRSERLVAQLCAVQPWLRAPVDLSQRVWAELEQRRSWWRLPLAAWPRWAQTCAVLACLACLALLQNESMTPQLHAAFDVTLTLAGVMTPLMQALSAVFWQGSLMFWLLVAGLLAGSTLLLSAGAAVLRRLAHQI